jgi:hypothetical protein
LNPLMHDWWFSSLTVSLNPNRAVLKFVAPEEGDKEIVIEDFVSIVLPQKNVWGSSAYVNEGGTKFVGGKECFWLEMQSGDRIVIEKLVSDKNVR